MSGNEEDFVSDRFTLCFFLQNTDSHIRQCKKRKMCSETASNDISDDGSDYIPSDEGSFHYCEDEDLERKIKKEKGNDLMEENDKY